MLPLHPGHPGHESALIVAFALVVVTAAFALTRSGWSRVGALAGVAVVAGGIRVGFELLGVHAHGVIHLLGHGLELSAVVLLALAGYYAISETTTTPTEH